MRSYGVLMKRGRGRSGQSGSTKLLRIGHSLVREGLITNVSPGLQALCAAISRKTGWPQPRPNKTNQWEMIDRYDAAGAWKKVQPTTTQSAPPPLKASYEERKRAREAFYASPAWRAVRYKALKINGAACQCCGATAKTSGKPMHVDHIKPRYKHPELELEITNLQVLCEDCNMGKGSTDETDWRK